MILKRVLLCFHLAACIACGQVPDATAPRAYVGARLIPIAGPEIEQGALVVQGGKITAVGAAKSVAIPANAERIDVTGKIIMPGLVDTHIHYPQGAVVAE
jgi:imidazolonepropionase-like amidohydrolase